MADSEVSIKGMVHIITVGTSPIPGVKDVVDALVDDLRTCQPRRVVILCTEDSTENAKRLLKGIGLKGDLGRVRQIQSANSLDEAYQATNEEIIRLLEEGFKNADIILHYTAGTKVMSAGAVLAAVNHEVQALRYLYSKGRGEPSIPIATIPQAILADNRLRLAGTLMKELRFRAAHDVLRSIEGESQTESHRTQATVLKDLSLAYSEWDSFRAREFLRHYRRAEPLIESQAAAARFRLNDKQLAALEAIAQTDESETLFPDELLLDLMNNALRRLAERRPDDALIRLHRAAELLAQAALIADHRIRTDDVEIRRVPPRYRASFEAERRMDDATIKLGLRKSYDLLEILQNPLGLAYREHETFRRTLQERRNLVLAHGTRPATMRLAIDFFTEVQELMKLRVKDVVRRMEAQQFPWINNKTVLERLRRAPAPDQSVLEEDKVKRRAAAKAGAAPAQEEKPRRDSQAHNKSGGKRNRN